MNKTVTKTTEIPNSLSDVPAVAAAAVVLRQAESLQRAAEAEVERLTGESEFGASDDMLNGLAEQALAGVSLGSLCTDGATIAGKLADAKRAVQVAERAAALANSRLVETMKGEFESLVPHIKNEYAGHIAEIASLLLGLTKASLGERLFRGKYDTGSLRIFQNRCPVMALPVDTERIRTWLSEGVAAGLLEAAVIREYEALLPRHVRS